MSTKSVRIGETIYGPDQLIPLETVSQYIGLSVRTVQDMASRRALPVHKIGRNVRIRISELDEWLTDTKVRGAQPPLRTQTRRRGQS
ncbi:helix-turn-helix domain-containing protein [Halofilum ochraceum]|uniref:helix-turn-helix domain-containing protein n=1 Tax=Halofilum ochraceum TaxID=1611323 RepID=UPI000946BF7C